MNFAGFKGCGPVVLGRTLRGCGSPFPRGDCWKTAAEEGAALGPEGCIGRAVPPFALLLSPSVNENVTTVTS